MAEAPEPKRQVPPNQMPAPEPIPGCPPGLEYLSQVDQIMVAQQVELLEVATGWETENKYSVRNKLGQNIYYASEQSNCCVRQCCGGSRPFSMSMIDPTLREVLHLERPLRCSWCPCFCCLQHVEVQSPPGTVIGYIDQDISLVYPWFSIKDANGETQLKIKGPCCACKWCEVEFEVLSADGSETMGKITKQWAGLSKEYFTDADNFGIQFPMDLDVKMKAVMLGACFLIDFMFFES